MQIPIIFGRSGYNTLGVIRCFAEKKCSFFLILISNSRIDSILFSKYVKKYKIVDNEKEGIEYILRNKKEWSGSVIIPTSDGAESFLDNNLDNLKDFYSFPHSKKQGSVNRLMDKIKQVEIADKSGLYTPRTFSYSRGCNLPKNIKYPCLVKPQKSISGCKEAIKICKNKRELISALNKPVFTTQFLIQQYINKDYELLLIGCRLPNGCLYIPGVFKKDRWYMEGNDASFGTISTDVSQYFSQLSEVESFINTMNFYGLFSIEFGVEKGKPYFYEINFRNDGTSHYFHKAGIYLPYIYFLSNIGCLEKKELRLKSSSYLFIDELGDFINLKSTNLSISEWFSNLREAKAYKYFSKHDILPFLLMLPRRVLATLYKMIF